MYAVIRTGGRQYRVREGDVIDVELLRAAAGDEITLSEVLLVEGDDGATVGAPLVEGAAVTARVEAQVRTDKVLIYKYKNKTRRRTLNGHRQPLTRIAITRITAG